MNETLFEELLDDLSELVQVQIKQADALISISKRLSHIESTLWEGLFYDEGDTCRPQILEIALTVKDLERQIKGGLS